MLIQSLIALVIEEVPQDNPVGAFVLLFHFLLFVVEAGVYRSSGEGLQGKNVRTPPPSPSSKDFHSNQERSMIFLTFTYAVGPNLICAVFSPQCTRNRAIGSWAFALPKTTVFYVCTTQPLPRISTQIKREACPLPLQWALISFVQCFPQYTWNRTIASCLVWPFALPEIKVFYILCMTQLLGWSL